VPKPHTPLQWCAHESLDEIRRKQAVLRGTVNEQGLRLKHHDPGISFVEGVLARGDRRIADVVEAVWRAGARFDGWDEVFDLGRWQAALADAGVDVEAYLGTRPVTARLPWDHLDVGLEDGFLLGEYRKALKGRASPPCGKVAGMLIHHTNLEDAEPDRRKLVCYDCGVACDLGAMRADRLVALRALGATARPAARGGALPMVEDGAGLDVSERGGGSPAEQGDRAPRADGKAGLARDNERAERVRRGGFKGADLPYSTYRIRFAKVGRASFLGHLDLGRLLARSLRRADLPLAMSRGFSPKPRMTFGPALGLGIPSLGEIVDVDLEFAPTVDGRFVRSFTAAAGAPRAEVPAEEVRERLASVCPPGIEVLDCRIVRLAGHPIALASKNPDVGLGKLIDAVDVLVKPAPDGMAFDAARLRRIADAFLAKPHVHLWRGERSVDVRALVTEVEVLDGDAATRLAGALDWPDTPALLRLRVRSTAEGSAKPQELARALGVWGADDLRAEHAQVARLGVVEVVAPARRAVVRPPAELVVEAAAPAPAVDEHA
jgi:hypothetical protein